ncbi:MAG: ATPase, partial [Actinomycetes bacterium]
MTDLPTVPTSDPAPDPARPDRAGLDRAGLDPAGPDPAGPDRADVVRPHAEHAYAHELVALAAADTRPRPPQWRLSPWAVVTYLMG